MCGCRTVPCPGNDIHSIEPRVQVLQGADPQQLEHLAKSLQDGGLEDSRAATANGRHLH